MKQTVCQIQGCGKKVLARGWCSMHYSRIQRYGDPDANSRQKRGEACQFQGCGRAVRAQGLCTGHYQQKSKGRPLSPLREKWSPTARDDRGRKRCRRCLEWLSEDSFIRKTECADGLMTWCRRCDTDRKIRNTYGITLKQYEERLKAQGGGCAICGGVNKDGRMLAVDHDHACCPSPKSCGSCIRGLLCSNCNLHLGAVGDSIDHLESMITYLRAFMVAPQRDHAQVAAEEAQLKGGADDPGR